MQNKTPHYKKKKKSNFDKFLEYESTYKTWNEMCKISE